MFIIAWPILGLIGGYLASRKGYPPKLGIIYGVLFGPLGLLVALFLPMTAEGRQNRELENQVEVELAQARRQKDCPECGCTHSVVNRYCPSCMHDYQTQPLDIEPT